jgi:cold shock CspA family protein
MSDAINNRHHGRIVSFLASYGFIQPNACAKRVFFHVSDLTGDIHPVLGDAVTYAVGEDQQGRTKAIEINLFRHTRP